MANTEKWDLTDIYADDSGFEKDTVRINELAKAINSMQGKLADIAVLREVLLTDTELSKLLEKAYGYAHLRYDLNHTDAAAQAMHDRAMTVYYAAVEATSFILPELTALPDGVTEKALAVYPELADYAHFLDDVRRHKPHVLSKREEQLLTLAAPALSSMDTAFSMLESADLDKGTVTDENGKTVKLTDGEFAKLRESRDRRVRADAFRALHEAFAGVGNTVSSLYAGQVRADLFEAKARHYDACLSRALFADRLPESLYSGLIEAVHKCLPAHYRYLELRRKTLGVEKLHLYDGYVPLVRSADDISYTYEEAKTLVKKYLAPLGTQYGKDLDRLLAGGWVDVYEAPGKETGAYATGIYGVHPYMLLNFVGKLNDVFTLAHEAGHCMHTYYSDTQPYINKDYPIFLAEIASTVNENLLLRGMLADTDDKDKQAYLLNHFIDEVRGTIIRQTMFAEFEWEAHKLAERGEPLTAEVFCKLYHELLSLYFGPDVEIDPYMDWEWARIPHFYRAFYVFKYATGFSAAAAISKRLLETGEAAPYLAFLHAGGSDYPLETLKKVGVDLSTPVPVTEALSEFEDSIAQLEKLLK